MSDTGGGHRASAEALIEGFGARFPEQFDLSMVDLWKHHTPWPIRRIPDTYPFLVNRVPWLWSAMWHASHGSRISDGAIEVARRASHDHAVRLMRRERPGLVVSVHPLLQTLAYHALRQVAPEAGFVTVVTDLASAHASWFFRPALRCYVASDEAAARAGQAGLTPDQIRLFGLPVRLGFAGTPPPQPQVRAALGLPLEPLAALVVGGGEGMGRLKHIALAAADRLSRLDRPTQLVVICGRNRELRADLESRDWPVPVRVEGFVDNMPDWMAAADCIVTKAGPGTIAEAATRGLPVLLSGFIPGQEEGNVAFVVDGGMGAFSDHPGEVADILAEWLGGDGERLAELRRHARALAHPDATLRIVEDIAALTGAPSQGASG
jgi:1,2-diacylglycerol 3-beta-galactosyltransferase